MVAASFAATMQAFASNLLRRDRRVQWSLDPSLARPSRAIEDANTNRMPMRLSALKVRKSAAMSSGYSRYDLAHRSLRGGPAHSHAHRRGL
jgi:hypothetical protein